MTFPSVESTSSGGSSANGTTYAHTLPSTVSVGALLLGFTGKDGAGAFTWGSGFAGWTALDSGSNGGTATCQGAAYYKIADGTEDAGTLNISGPSETHSYVIYSITGHDPNTPPAFATVGSGTTASADPNPASLNPADWGTEDTLWCAACMGDEGTGVGAVTAGPSGYSGFTAANSTAGSGDCVAAAAWIQTNAASADPGAFTRASEQWRTETVGVRPAPTAHAQPILSHFTSYSASGNPSFSYVLPAGSNRRVFFAVLLQGAAQTVSSMTFGGNTCTRCTDGSVTANVSVGSAATAELWEIKEADLPSNGSQTVAVTLSGSVECSVHCITVSGANQSTNLDDVVTNSTAGATSLTTAVTVATNNSIIIGISVKDGTPNFTTSTIAGFQAVGRGDCGLPTGAAFARMFVKGLTTESGSQNVVFGQAASVRSCALAIVLAPATGDVEVAGSGSGVTGTVAAGTGVADIAPAATGAGAAAAVAAGQGVATVSVAATGSGVSAAVGAGQAAADVSAIASGGAAGAATGAGQVAVDVTLVATGASAGAEAAAGTGVATLAAPATGSGASGAVAPGQAVAAVSALATGSGASGEVAAGQAGTEVGFEVIATGSGISASASAGTASVAVVVAATGSGVGAATAAGTASPEGPTTEDPDTVLGITWDASSAPGIVWGDSTAPGIAWDAAEELEIAA